MCWRAVKQKSSHFILQELSSYVVFMPIYIHGSSRYKKPPRDMHDFHDVSIRHARRHGRYTII